MYKRIIIIVLDSCGAGALPDADAFGDAGTNTLGHIGANVEGLCLPVLQKLGLGNITAIAGVPANSKPAGSYGLMAEASQAKDTTSGHWEIAGCPVFTPFPTYPDGFPEEVVTRFTAVTGYKMLGNKPASGTAIIEELGHEHLATGQPIVYTSADSVFQIAAHQDVFPLEKLYALCQTVRSKICIGRNAVGRVIARPFIGKPGSFVRTPYRHDYSLEPIGPTMLDRLKAAGKDVIGVGKIGDIFAQRGLTATYPTKSNDEGMSRTSSLLATDFSGLLFTNLVEFDSNYGHRRNVNGYAAALQRFDAQLALLLDMLGSDDMLILTADHGCDPTAHGSDHTREYVPLIVYSPALIGSDLGTRMTFADVAATVLSNFALPQLTYGKSFL